MNPHRFSWFAVTVIVASLTIPAFCSTQGARRAGEPSPGLQATVVRATEELRPFALQRNVSFIVTSRALHAPTDNPLTDAMHERVLDLLANAVAMSAAGHPLEVSVSERSVRVWIPNPTLRFSVERTVYDTQGHGFNLRSVANQGTELSLEVP